MKSPVNAPTLLPAGLAVDRALLRRIVLSSAFAKSPRLSHFLRYICTEVEEGRYSKINEQHIGNAVFGRDPDYDSTVDSIVRSHASRLRLRLREYFETEGLNEPVILSVPKGSYIPRFEPRALEVALSVEADLDSRTVYAGLSSLEETAMGLAPPTQGIADEESAKTDTAPARGLVRRWQIAFGLATIAALVMGSLLAFHLSGSRHQMHHIFWTPFLLSRNGHTTLVEADSGLVMLQHFTHRPVSLASYIDGSYLHDVSSPNQKSELVTQLGSRRYTPAVDSSIYAAVLHLLPDTKENLDIRYARDMRLDDLKKETRFCWVPTNLTHGLSSSKVP